MDLILNAVPQQTQMSSDAASALDRLWAYAARVVEDRQTFSRPWVSGTWTPA